MGCEGAIHLCEDIPFMLGLRKAGLLAEAKRIGAAVKLSVLKSNPARSLYQRLGFVIVGENDQSLLMVCNAA